MKNRHYTIVLLLLGVLATIVISCKNESNGSLTYDPNKPVVVTTIFPDSGRISEMVLLDGQNFGTDRSQIKVFFNSTQATVINSTGTRILVLVPRLPGDECVIRVEIGEQTKEYADLFSYKIAASVSTLAGNGNGGFVIDQGLDKSEIRPVYIGIDGDFNIFVSDESHNLLRINKETNSIDVIATSAQGYVARVVPYANPRTNVLQLGMEGGLEVRDKFIFCDPRVGWIPKSMFIKEWDWNGYGVDKTGTTGTHYFCLLCEEDGNYYTRYDNGLLVRIDPRTWKAKAVGMTPSGQVFGAAMHPIHKKEMWLAYNENAGQIANSICKVDVTNEVANTDDQKFLSTFIKLSGPTNGDYRDGILEDAQFRHPRMINFDTDGNLYVGDNGNHCIRMINTTTMMVETIIGIPTISGFKDGNKDEALFNAPHGIIIDSEGIIYVSDYWNRRVRRIAIE